MAIATDTRLVQSTESKSLGSVITATRDFKQLGANDQIVLLWCIYAEVGEAIATIVQGASRLHLAQLLIEQIKQMTDTKQLQIMRDLANQVNTPISRSYGVMSVNTKLSFWYVLADSMQKNIELPISDHRQISTAAKHVLETIKRLTCGQQITLLRNAVIDMGVDPLLS
jgi:Orange carotenoid protein, N-terminal